MSVCCISMAKYKQHTRLNNSKRRKRNQTSFARVAKYIRNQDQENAHVDLTELSTAEIETARSACGQTPPPLQALAEIMQGSTASA